jgi:putative SOS response-associated peptidase YedK
VPVNSFYEWKKTGTGNQPYAIALADRGLMALAGLWENWRSPAGEWIRSFAIVTTEPNELCAELHNRMPVVLKPESWPVWLGEEPTVPSDLKALLAPFPSEEMTCWPVSARVGNVKNNHVDLRERGERWHHGRQICRRRRLKTRLDSLDRRRRRQASRCHLPA